MAGFWTWTASSAFNPWSPIGEIDSTAHERIRISLILEQVEGRRRMTAANVAAITDLLRISTVLFIHLTCYCARWQIYAKIVNFQIIAGKIPIFVGKGNAMYVPKNRKDWTGAFPVHLPNNGFR